MAGVGTGHTPEEDGEGEGGGGGLALLLAERAALLLGEVFIFLYIVNVRPSPFVQLIENKLEGKKSIDLLFGQYPLLRSRL